MFSSDEAFGNGIGGGKPALGAMTCSANGV